MTIKIIKSRCRNWNRMQNNRFYLKVFEEKRYFKTRNMLIYFLKHANNQFVNSKLYWDFLRWRGEISYLSVIKFNVRKIKSCKYKLAHFSLLIVVHLFHICMVVDIFPCRNMIYCKALYGCGEICHIIFCVSAYFATICFVWISGAKFQ